MCIYFITTYCKFKMCYLPPWIMLWFPLWRGLVHLKDTGEPWLLDLDHNEDYNEHTICFWVSSFGFALLQEGSILILDTLFLFSLELFLILSLLSLLSQCHHHGWSRKRRHNMRHHWLPALWPQCLPKWPFCFQQGNFEPKWGPSCPCGLRVEHWCRGCKWHNPQCECGHRWPRGHKAHVHADIMHELSLRQK